MYKCNEHGDSRILKKKQRFEHVELPAKLLDYFLRSDTATSINIE